MTPTFVALTGRGRPRPVERTNGIALIKSIIVNTDIVFLIDALAISF